jgi:predicted transcriptional regulator
VAHAPLTRRNDVGDAEHFAARVRIHAAGRDDFRRSWPEQPRSPRCLLDYRFEWVFAGHGGRRYLPAEMTKQIIKDLIGRIATWPEADQEELAEYALEIEARHTGAHHATREELEGIDRGLKDAREGRFAAEEEVEAAFAKFRA